jgi:serine/threonine-protein kinase
MPLNPTQGMEAVPGPDPIVGKVFAGRYRIVRKLGEGGMGAVYVGEQQMGTNIRKVAVKTLHPHLSHDPKILARFERECGTVSELQHPNTIQVFDFGKTEDGTLFIVMEFVEGRSVADILEKDGPMPPDRVLRILTQVCGSLAEAHERGIVHRDLKPDNVVLCRKAGQDDWVEVLDFGIAKRSNEVDTNEAKLTQQGMVLGTPPYMSPEQFTGKPVGSASDIYSLGVMAYEMLTGRLPFHGNTAWEWASAHMTAPPDLTKLGSHVPAAMHAAIGKSLAKSPTDRFPDVNAFLDALKGVTVAPAGPHGFGVQEANGPAARNRTEIGTPLDLPPSAFAATGPAPAAPASALGGNFAASTAQAASAQPITAPGVVPPSEARSAPKSGGKGPMLAVIGVLGLASAGAVVFALSGNKSGASTAPTTPTATSAPLTQLAGSGATATGAPSPTPTTATAEPHGDIHEPLPDLTPAGGTPAGQARPAPRPSGTPTTRPTASAGGTTAGATTGAAAGTTAGTSPAPSTPTPPPATTITPEQRDKICAAARAAKASGGKLADTLAARCIAAGGTP